MDLCLARIIRHAAHQFWVFERRADAHLPGWCKDFAVEGPRDAHADAFFAYAVGAADYEEAAAGFISGGNRHGDAIIFGFYRGCLDELLHALACTLTFRYFPGVGFFSAFFFEGHAHVGAGFDDVFLGGEGVTWV